MVNNEHASLLHVSLYFVLVVESSLFGAGMGRLSQGILFDLINSGMIGYKTQLLAIISIPFFLFDIVTLTLYCIGLYLLTVKYFIPYLVWRAIKNLLYLTAVLIVFLLGLRDQYAGAMQIDSSDMAIGVWITHIGLGLAAFILVSKAQASLRRRHRFYKSHTKNTVTTRCTQTQDDSAVLRPLSDNEIIHEDNCIYFPMSNPVALSLVDHSPNRIRMQQMLERYA